ncbi:MAG: FkbM family methyltransferase [Gammaproteobacteria bacterium]
MKLNLHNKIARMFGYELVRLSRMPYRDIHAHLLELFRRLDINCVLDVGANMGQYATGLRNAGFTGHILSFEPVRECFDALARHQDERWRIFNFALGAAAATLDFQVTRKNVFSSFLSPNEYAAKRFRESARVTGTEKVMVKRLDDVFSGIVPLSEPRVFLKLDTQGYDLEVLKGARKVLPFIRGLQSEISCKAIYSGMPTHIESLKFIDELGYEITDIYPLGHDKQDMCLLEFDCVFRKRSA